MLLSDVNRLEGPILTSSRMVYKRCWLSLLFWRTANMRRAPLRAFERPIILAARSIGAHVLSDVIIKSKGHTWYQRRKHTVRIITSLCLFFSRSRGRRLPELPSWPCGVPQGSNEVHDMHLIKKVVNGVPNFPNKCVVS